MTAPPFPAAALAAARDAAKAHLRIDGDGENAALAARAEAALELCEAFTGSATLTRSRSEMLPASPWWQPLAAAPVLAITGVEGVATDGSTLPLAAGAHAVDIDAQGQGWVRLTAAVPARRLRVTYSAGIAAEWETLPAGLREGVVLLTAHLFEARAEGGAPPAAVAALWRPWRRMRLGMPRART